MGGHDGIGRDRCLQLTRRMRAAADHRVGIDRSVWLACGHCVGLPGIRERCRGRGATRDLVSLSLENDRGRSHSSEDERRRSHEAPPLAAL
jgi:hypothetical protein